LRMSAISPKRRSKRSNQPTWQLKRCPCTRSGYLERISSFRRSCSASYALLHSQSSISHLHDQPRVELGILVAAALGVRQHPCPADTVVETVVHVTVHPQVRLPAANLLLQVGHVGRGQQIVG